MPRVTVLTSVCNGAEHLQEAIASIFSQTMPDFEFIIVDDASNDGTPAILDRLREPRLVLSRNEKNRGLTWSLNMGLRRARGEFIARMDADDISEPVRLQAQMEFLRSHPDVGLVCSAAAIIDERGKTVGAHAPRFSPEHFYFYLNFKNCIIHSSVLFRREIVERLGGYDESLTFAQDYELWFRLSKVARIAQIDQPLVCWRRHADNISVRNKEVQDQAVYEVAADNLRRLTGREISPTELQRLQLERPRDENELENAIAIMNGLRRGLASQEGEIMKTLHLREGAVARVVRESTGQLFSRYLRSLPRRQWPGFLLRAAARRPLLLGERIAAAVALRARGRRRVRPADDPRHSC